MEAQRPGKQVFTFACRSALLKITACFTLYLCENAPLHRSSNNMLNIAIC